MAASQGLDLPFPRPCLPEEEDVKRRARQCTEDIRGLGCSSVVQHVLTMLNALDSTTAYRDRRTKVGKGGSHRTTDSQGPTDNVRTTERAGVEGELTAP